MLPRLALVVTALLPIPSVAQELPVFRTTLPSAILFSGEDNEQSAPPEIDIPEEPAVNQYEWFEWQPATEIVDGVYSIEPNLPAGLSIDSDNGRIYGKPVSAGNYGPFSISVEQNGETYLSDEDFIITIASTPYEKGGRKVSKTVLLNGEAISGSGMNLEAGDILELVYPEPVWAKSFLFQSYTGGSTLDGKVYAMIDGSWVLIMDENSTNPWSVPISGYFNRYGSSNMPDGQNQIVSDRFRIVMDKGAVYSASNPYVN